VTVTAYQMTNAQLATLEVPSLALQVYRPDQTVQPVTLRPDPGRPGSYVGQFTVLQEGDYRLELPVPESNEERLTQRIRVEIPNLERERPQRNDAVLGEIARKTGDGQQSAKYFVGLGAILDSQSGLVEMLKDRTRTITLTATPSRDRQERWLLWLMLGLFGFLCLEWTIRRLCKLA
jgi:hypothetical protein